MSKNLKKLHVLDAHIHSLYKGLFGSLINVAILGHEVSGLFLTLGSGTSGAQNHIVGATPLVDSGPSNLLTHFVDSLTHFVVS